MWVELKEVGFESFVQRSLFVEVSAGVRERFGHCL